MKNVIYFLIACLLCSACGESFEDAVAEGNYDVAESIIMKTKNEKKYQYAEILIDEYIDMEELDKALNVYERLTPEHCGNNYIGHSYYGHGYEGRYELNVTNKFRQEFIKQGEYDIVWKYYPWENEEPTSSSNAHSYYRFMNEVILYLCSVDKKAEARAFLRHYLNWFSVNIDMDSYSVNKYPEFNSENVKFQLQNIIDKY